MALARQLTLQQVATTSVNSVYKQRTAQCYLHLLMILFYNVS